jgi:DNA-binding NarL/FixJ family response regulator
VEEKFADALSGSACRPKRLIGPAPELTVLLVDGRPWTRESLARALETACRGFRVLCVSEVAELAPMDVQGDALILLNMTGAGRLDRCVSAAIATAHSCLPALPVVALSDNVEAEGILGALEQGLDGYIPISTEVKLVVNALKFVAAGGTFVPAELVLDGLDAGAPGAIRREREDGAGGETRGTAPQGAADVRLLLKALTPREQAVLLVLRQGKSNKHIARELDMREATVKVHVRHIMRKLGASNRTQVALLAEHLPEN